MRLTHLPALGTLALVIALAGCSPSTPAPGDSTSPGGGGSAAAPSPTPTPSSSAGLAELVLTGDAAGMTFSKVDEQAQTQSGGLAEVFQRIKVSPAECKAPLGEVLSGAITESDSQVALARSGQAIYTSAVNRSAMTPAAGRAELEKCQNLTFEISGLKLSGNLEVSDLTAGGAEEAFRATMTIEVPQAGKQTASTNVGRVNGVNLAATGQGIGVDQATIDQVFTAQAEKIRNG